MAIALLTALAGAVTLTALAGSRRTRTAVDRAADRVRVADVGVDVAVADSARRQRLAELPMVEETSTYVFIAVRPAGTTLRGGLDVVGVAPLDNRAGVTMDVPRLRAGRLADPDKPDEVLLSTSLADRIHKKVGERVTVEAYRQSQVNDIFADASEPVQPAGARLDLRVVGIGDTLETVGASGNEGLTGVIVISRAAFATHGAAEPDYRNEDIPESDIGVFRLVARARLRHGAEDAPALLRALPSVFGDEIDTTFSEARGEVFALANDSVRVEAIALLLFAAAAAAAGLVAAGQAAARESVLPIIEDELPLRAMGLSQRTRVVAAVAPVTLAVAVGMAGAAAAAWFASRWMPRGLARRYEPDPGMAFDGWVLVGGALLLGVLISVRGALAAWWVASRPGAEPAETPAGRTIARLPVVPALGVTLALRSGRGRRALPARPSLVGAVIAVAGVVAAFVFGSSLDLLTSTPRLYGRDWDREIVLQTEGEDISAREAPALAADRRLSAVAAYRLFEASIEGDAEHQAITLDPLKGEVGPTLLAGRYPAAPDEVAVASSEVPGPGPSLGTTVKMATGDGSVRLRVVGEITSAEASFIVTPAGAERLTDEISDAGFFVRFAQGVDHAAAVADLEQRFVQVEGPTVPDRVTNVGKTRGFPYALGAFLAVLGLAAVGHLLATTVRRRRYDVAVARALGMTAAQTRAVTAWQAVTVALIGVALGIPLGIIVGRAAWTGVANALHVVNEVRIPGVTLLVVVVTAPILALVLSLLPGAAAARVRAAEELRTP